MSDTESLNAQINGNLLEMTRQGNLLGTALIGIVSLLIVQFNHSDLLFWALLQLFGSVFFGIMVHGVYAMSYFRKSQESSRAGKMLLPTVFLSLHLSFLLSALIFIVISFFQIKSP